MKKIFVWKGTHTPSLFNLIHQAWHEGHLLILMPPQYLDFSFLKHLPAYDYLEPVGDWTPHEKELFEPSVEQYFKSQSHFKVHYPEEVLMGVFSSGTTSVQRKLVLYSKKNIQSSIDSILELFQKSDIKKIFCYPQPYHTFGLILGYHLSFLNSIEFVSLEGMYHSHFHEKWRDHHSPHLLTLGAPAHFSDLISWCKTHSFSPPPSAYSIVGGARVSRSLWFDQKNILNIQNPSIGYGCTEASPGITHLPPGIEPIHDGEIGQFLKNVTYLPSDGNGYYFQGPNLCAAIIHDDQLTFPERILVRDHIEKLESNRFIYKGRTDFILNRGGEKFPLEAMEHLLFTQLSIEAVCGTTPDPRLGEELTILYKNPSSHETVTSEKISHFLKKTYQRHFNPHLFIETHTLPFTVNGKLNRMDAQKIIQEAL